MGEIQRQGEANAHVFLVVDLQMCSPKRKNTSARVCRRPRNFMAFNSVIGDVFGWLRVFL